MSINHGWNDHVWIETGRAEGSTQYACECGSVMARGAGKIENEDEAFERRVVEAVVRNLERNGEIAAKLACTIPNRRVTTSAV